MGPERGPFLGDGNGFRGMMVRNPRLPGCCGGFHGFSIWLVLKTRNFWNHSNLPKPNQLNAIRTSDVCVSCAFACFFLTCQVRASRFQQRCNSFLLPSSSTSSGCCGGRLDPNTCQIQCQNICQKDPESMLDFLLNVRIDARKNVKNTCQIECSKECQNLCQMECPKECQWEKGLRTWLPFGISTVV